MAFESLARHWYARDAVSRLLTPLAWIFGIVVFVRRAFYRSGIFGSVRIGLPLIVVGNLVAGGSGKTPLVLWLAEFLKARGYRPGIVSRGYGGSVSARRAAPLEAGARSDPGLVGDEPLLLARRSGCPVWVAADRVAACRALRTGHPECDVIILDDGLQHYRLARDFEIAVVDARGFGNGLLFPAGPLREPVSRLASVDAVVSNGASGLQSHAMRVEGAMFLRLDGGGSPLEAGALGGRSVHAVAGIGDPPRFFRHLEALGLEVIPHPFPDHHAYVAADLEFGDRLPVVMTEKDAVKCERIVAGQPRFWMLPVRAELDPGFGAVLVEKLRGISGGPKTA